MVRINIWVYFAVVNSNTCGQSVGVKRSTATISSSSSVVKQVCKLIPQLKDKKALGLKVNCSDFAYWISATNTASCNCFMIENYLVIVKVICFMDKFCLKGKGAMRLTLWEAPTCEKRLNHKTGNCNHGQKSWDKFTFVAFFHTRQTNSSTLVQPLPPILQCWTHVHTISPEFQHCIGGGGKKQCILKWITVLFKNTEN